MGPAEVAAWGILGVIWDTFERITSGFADAAEVRIGFRMGAGQPLKAKLAAYKAICMSVMVALVSTVVLAIMAGHLPRWMTPDPTLQKMVNAIGCLQSHDLPLCLHVSHSFAFLPQIFEALPLVRRELRFLFLSMNLHCSRDLTIVFL